MNIRFSFLSLLELTHIFPWCDSKLPFKCPKQVIIVSKSTYFIDFRHRISLFQKPFAQNGEAITSVKIKDQSVVSSGIYERYFEKDGKIYHHILNPFTGYPYETHLQQVTIISDASVDGDALSTTCFALGLEEGSKLIKSLDEIEAIFVTDDGNIHRVG